MEAMGGSVDVKESDLSSMASRDILLRMLRNLKGIYSRCDLSRCLNVQHRIVTLSDNDPTEIQDLGILYFHLGKPVLAVKTFDKLMREHPTLGEREVVKSYMSKATQKAVLLN
jgi:regulator of sirC expression with transglutaminase-like and TPR domain